MKYQNTVVCAAMMAILLSACAGESSNPVITETEELLTTEVVTEALITDNLPERDFGGADYTVLAAAEHCINKYYLDEATGDVVDDAVFERNRAVEDRFNIKFVYETLNGYSAGKTEVKARLDNAVMSGDATYDHFIGDTFYVTGSVMGGVFTNLLDLEYLDFSQPYWLQYVNPNLRVAGTQFFACGAYDLQAVSENWIIMFNKEVATEFDMTSFYDDVRDGSWTIDKFLSYAKQVPQDLDGNGKFNESDRFGLVSTAQEAFYAFPYGMGRTITAVGDDGIPYLTGVDDRIVTMMEKLTYLLKEDHLYFGSDSTIPADQIVPMFANNQSLFLCYLLRIIETEDVRNACDFGILPIPKYDEEQKDYLTTLPAFATAIPFVCPDLERSQIIIEALNSASYTMTLPIYKERALQRKLTRDDESAEMLDIIFAGGVCDFGLAYCSELDYKLYSVGLILQTQEYATWWAKNEKSLTTKLNKLIETMESLKDR